MGTFKNSKDPDEKAKYDFYTDKVKKNLRTKKYNIFENYNPTTLEMYNGLSQVYCIKPEGRIH